MHNLSATELLTIWEHTLNQSPVHRALGLLTVAFPEYTPEQLARLSIGQRDTLLLNLRERLFGSRLDSTIACPQCQQQIELAFSTSDIRVEPTPSGVNDSAATAMSLTLEGYKVNFRLPNSIDLVSIETCTPADHAHEQLLHQCIQSVTRLTEDNDQEETSNDVRQLPASLIDAIAERMAEADPQANTQLALTCPDCSHVWNATFDIVTYLMDEIHRLAKHILQEIHNLARAYGWREADILEMTSIRRRAYLELLGLG
ncbi:hypothetical protein [Nitrosomonas sp. Nm166]|uniref:T4 family baseplate hub assembly chaperone n=1 Tax=Nitrosomonas sp. Nm166 TaxID=1881054 RepID=UPI0008DFA4BB|nr:hypothetical protein [Nitrosomonas sp. Nm166]SFE85537.1 T4 bacteriophage base plate protein [Nitrosomonas sp. Nm166]